MTDVAAAPVPSGKAALRERAREMAVLQAAVKGAATSTAQFLVVEGPAGIGKSRLLSELRAATDEAGFRVLTARGTDLERAFPFGVVRQLFEPLLASEEADERWLAGAAAAAAPVFGTPDLDRFGHDASFAALHGLYWLTLNTAGDAPLALLVDDVHWSDVPSLRFLAYVVGRLEGLPILIAVGLRNTEEGTDPVLLGEIAGDPLAVHVGPGPLTVEAVGGLVIDRLGAAPERDFVDACHEATGGNPLLVDELLKTLAAEGIPPEADRVASVRELGSRAVSRSVLVRLGRLSPDATAAARAVAVLGEAVDVGVVSVLAELDERRVAAATRELTRAEILKPDLPLGFVHPLVQDAVYQDLAPGERELMHSRAVDALRSVNAPIEQVAAHWLILPRRGDPAVAAMLHDVGMAAEQQGAPDSAVAYLRRALEEPLEKEDRIRLLLDLGITEMDVNLQAATEHIREAHAGLTNPVQRAAAAEALARQVCFTGTGEEAAAILEAALDELPAEMEDQRKRLQAMQFVAVNFGAPEPDIEARIDGLARDIYGASAGAKSLQAMIALHSAYACRPQRACVPMALEALKDRSIIAADPGISTIGAIQVLVLAERPEPLDIWEEVREVTHRLGSLIGSAGMYLWRGWTLLQLGEIDDAEPSLRQAAKVEASWVLDTGQGVLYTSAFLAQALIEQGDLEGARKALERQGTAVPGSDGALFGSIAGAHLLNADGRFTEAIELLEAQAPYFPRADNPALMPWRAAQAAALAALDRVPEAIALMEEDLERARRWGAAAPIGRALRILGELEGDEARLQEAVDLLSGSPCRLERARALAALGQSIRLGRQPREAREPLAQALEIAESCGAAVLAKHVRSELYATGARPRSSARSGVGSLTASELRVANLATEGRTNRDIAQALYVTPKTVEVHLSSTYRKLGIRSRADLAAALIAA